MATSSRHARTLSPPLSTAFSSGTGGQTKFNVVTRVAIEGKARKSTHGKADGASIKMFLKIAIPLDSVNPGATIPLFSEENVKILDSQVHPLDSSSAPYNFSSTTSVLLHRGARALNLPARSRILYTSLFGSISSTSSSTSNPPPLEERYVGHILVSGYHVSYVLPKEFPPRIDEMQSRSSNRRMSSSTAMQFMAAIDMWIPFVSKPPHSPYLLSIPTPRCLHNHIKLRIFPPVARASVAASFASLSSAEEESGSWDLTSDPHVTHTTTPSRHSRSHSAHSYTHFADDESSDSSTAGFADGCGIQGTFQSAERIRIRWAKPMKSEELAGTLDGRRHVGIREVNGTTTCAILGSQGHDKGKGRGQLSADAGDGSVIMKVEYSATCKGLWFPGVATMIGLDVGLDVGDCDVDWAPEGEGKWIVSGSSGFTGFAACTPAPTPSLSRQSSASDSSSFLLPSSPDGRPNGAADLTNGYPQQSTFRQGSLLRVPLPTQSVPDYSFESSPNLTPTSSVASLATLPSSPEKVRRSRASSVNEGPYTDVDTDDAQGPASPPGVPVTIHVNMNELLPPSKSVLTLSISGTIVVSPRPASRTSSPTPTYLGGQPSSSDKNPVVLPRFRILHADKETSSILVRSELDGASIDVYNATGSIADAQSRKTVIQPGGQAKCGSEGARISIRYSQSPVSSLRPYPNYHGREDSFDEAPLLKTPRTPASGITNKSGSASILRRTGMLSPSMMRPARDGPLMIPSVAATITPLLSGSDAETGSVSKNYAVRVCLPAPSDADSEWLEFGLAIPSTSTSTDVSNTSTGPPKIRVASASLEGVPVHFETTAAMKAEKEGSASPTGLPFEETSGKEWVTWVKVHVGESGGGNVEVVYLVTGALEGQKSKVGGWKRKWKAKDGDPVLNVLLPTFSLPVGRLEVHVEAQAGFQIQAVRSNFTHESTSSTGRRLLHYSMDEFFYPRLSMTFQLSGAHAGSPSALWRVLQIASIITALLLLANNRILEAELSQAKESLLSFPTTQVETITEVPAPITVTSTSTIFSTTTTTTSVRWWADPTPPSSSSEAPLATTITTTVYASAPTPSTASLPTLTPTTMVPSPSSSQIFDIAMRDLPFLWPLRFEFPSLDEMPQVARLTVSKTLSGLGVAWQLFRRVLHYPLDPP